MKHLLFGALLCFCTPLLSQSAVDSVAIRQADSLIQISREFTGKRDFDKALEMNVAAEGVSLLKFGRESVSYGNCCHNRGKINYYKRDFPEATKWYLEAIDVRAKTLGKNDIGYSNSLNSLAYVYIDIGNYNAAEPLLLEVLSVRRKALGEEHPDYSSSLTTLATLYWHMSYYEKDLARTVAGYGTAMRQVSWQEVQNALKPGEAAIEFVHYSDGPDSIMYSAMLLRPGVEQPQFVSLFEQKQLESLLQANSGKARKADYVNAVYGIKTEKNNLQGQKTLYERLWRPLEKALADSHARTLKPATRFVVYAFRPTRIQLMLPGSIKTGLTGITNAIYTANTPGRN